MALLLIKLSSFDHIILEFVLACQCHLDYMRGTISTKKGEITGAMRSITAPVSRNISNQKVVVDSQCNEMDENSQADFALEASTNGVTSTINPDKEEGAKEVCMRVLLTL